MIFFILTAHDCYELGRIAYNEGDHYHTILWMREALALVEKENPTTILKSILIDYLSYSTYMVGFFLVASLLFTILGIHEIYKLIHVRNL